MRHHHLIIFHILALVTIDERHVELQAQPRHHLQRIANVHRNLVSPRRVPKPRQREVLLLIIDFHRMQVSVLWQSLRNAQA